MNNVRILRYLLKDTLVSKKLIFPSKRLDMLALLTLIKGPEISGPDVYHAFAFSSVTVTKQLELSVSFDLLHKKEADYYNGLANILNKFTEESLT